MIINFSEVFIKGSDQPKKKNTYAQSFKSPLPPPPTPPPFLQKNKKLQLRFIGLLNKVNVEQNTILKLQRLKTISLHFNIKKTYFYDSFCILSFKVNDNILSFTFSFVIFTFS